MAKNLFYSLMTYVQNILMASENKGKEKRNIGKSRGKEGRMERGNKEINEPENMYYLGIMYLT
jgi:uncharacterized lipoprotein YajG